MEDRLKTLFDYQRFAQNKHLASVIDGVMDKYSTEKKDSVVVPFEAKHNRAELLSDDDLMDVNAAQGISEMANKNNLNGKKY